MAVRVFLAEDNDDLALLVSKKLESRKWTVTRASTASEATQRLRGDRFDAIILDYKLPDGTGLELLNVARQSSPETPILFLTAHGSEDVALQALGLGASDYMQKTGTMLEELPQRVAGLLDRERDARASATVSVSVKDAHADARQAKRETQRKVDRAGAADEAFGVLTQDAAKKLVEEFVTGDILGAALFDGAGEPIAALLPRSLDARALGLALVQVHAQAVLMGRTTHLAPRSYTFTLETDEGTIAATGVPNKALIAVLVRPGSSHAPERLRTLAARVR